jgi:hypothetical protein
MTEHVCQKVDQLLSIIQLKKAKKLKKGLWYNIAMKRKRGEKMRKKGAKGAPTEAAIKKSQA